MNKKLIILGIGLLTIVALGAVFFLFLISEKVDFDGEKEFVVKKGDSLSIVAENLSQQGIIKNTDIFKIYLYIRGWQKNVQAGTYILTSTNVKDLAKILFVGDVKNEINLRFIEGWTASDMADYLVKEKIISKRDDFLNETRDAKKWQEKFLFLKDAGAINLEGFLFPDTYSVFKNATPSEIVDRTLENFNNKITPALLTEITANKRNLYDVLKMASIIEMEVLGEENRKIASGILWKRLDSGMALQVDSSLKYVIGKKDNPSLSFEELKIDSPYNTYKYRGLPPTPICNPGMSAIRSAVYPKNSDFWFYLTTKDGETIFSKTLDEHNAAIKKYLK
jgi:UPF0755 protein